MADLNLDTGKTYWMIEAEKLRLKNKRLRRLRIKRAKKKGTHTTKQWKEILSEFQNRCVKCGSESHIHKDHILPIYAGGSDSIENIQPLCRKCNLSKGPTCFNWKEYRRSNGWPG